MLIDTESANGTFVSGQRISRHVLKDGDVVQFATSAAFRYTLTDGSQEALLRQLFEASVTDALTGAFNRDYFDTQLSAELSFARRHKAELSLIMFDVDFFKKVNDTYGHPAGDQVLVRIARTVASMVRTEDVFARYGGEEFALILRGVNVTGAAALAERLRGAVQALSIPSERGAIRVTISAGCAGMTGGSEVSAEELIGSADKRLYAAKHGGRNRVVSSD
ncbi:MAG: diguanylate cyclase [Polyangiaceae bacterium]